MADSDVVRLVAPNGQRVSVAGSKRDARLRAGYRQVEAAVSSVPPRSGKGSGLDAWTEYASTNGVQVKDDATRDDVIEAVKAAGVPTE